MPPEKRRGARPGCNGRAPQKLTALGNGGMVFFDDDALLDRALALRAWGRSSEKWMFGTRAALIPIFRNLKQRFDPGSVLNPGRFQGAL